MDTTHQSHTPDVTSSEPDVTMTMLTGFIYGSLGGLATYQSLKADLLTIRGLPETRSCPPRERR